MGTYVGHLPLSECKYSHNSSLEVVGIPYHYLAEMNLFNLFALSSGGEQKCSFSARTRASVLLALTLLVVHVITCTTNNTSASMSRTLEHPAPLAPLTPASGTTCARTSVLFALALTLVSCSRSCLHHVTIMEFTRFFLKKNLGGHMSFCGATDTPVVDFS